MANIPIGSLTEAIAAYQQHLALRPLTDNTRKAFIGDIRIFAKYVHSMHSSSLQHTERVYPSQHAVSQGAPAAIALTAITSDVIKSFLAKQERSRTAGSPKSIERRLTSLKGFFNWLHEAGYLTVDPAESVAYKPYIDPLPDYLSESETTQALQAARQLASGSRLEMRPLTVILLVLETGIKKGECLALTVDDIDRTDVSAPCVWIRYQNVRMQFKDRKVAISQDCLGTINAHIRRYETRGALFDCTGRNLEYLFNRKVAPMAGLSALTFEMLRWTAAVRDYTGGRMGDEQMQIKYGLSPIGWMEMESKLARLTRAPSAEFLSTAE